MELWTVQGLHNHANACRNSHPFNIIARVDHSESSWLWSSAFEKSKKYVVGEGEKSFLVWVLSSRRVFGWDDCWHIKSFSALPPPTKKRTTRGSSEIRSSHTKVMKRLHYQLSLLAKSFENQGSMCTSWCHYYQSAVYSMRVSALPRCKPPD